MSLIIKFLMKNLKEKKIRSILVLISIGISAALLFATQGMSDTCEQMYYDQIIQWTGDSDIKIEMKEEIGGEQFLDQSDIEQVRNKLSYAIGMIKSKGLYNPNVEGMIYLDVVGTTLDDLNAYNEITLAEKGDIDTLEGDDIIISETFAQRASLKIGDRMELKFSEGIYSFTVQGIANQTSLFLNESTGVVAVVAKETLEEMYGVQDKSNLMYLKLKDATQLEATIHELSEMLPNNNVARSVNPSDLDQAVSTVVMPFRVSSLTVIIMSVFIIFTSFNLMTLERMPAIGTLRSIGTTKRTLRKVFVVESIVWGILGGLIGCILGSVILRLVVIRYVEMLSEGTVLTVRINPTQILVTIIFAVVLTLLSAMLPLLKSLKKSTKDIVLNSDTAKKADKGFRGVMFILLVSVYGACVIVPLTFKTSLMGMIVTIVCMTLILIVMVLMIPYGIRFIATIVERMTFIGNTRWLAMKNVATNKSLLNIVKLLSIAVASIVIIMSISNSISNTIEKVYDTYHLYDISMSHREADKAFSERLVNVEGVSSFVNNFEMDSVKLEEVSYYLNTLYGIEDASFFDFMGAGQTEASEKALQEINDGRHVVLTELLASKLGLSVGDEMTITMNNKSNVYTITGFIDSSYKLGNIGFISAQHMRDDLGLTYYTNTYIKVDDDVDKVIHHIKAEFLEDILFIQSLDELVEINQDLIVSIFRIINAYAVLALVIGIIGIINNVMVSYFERKRELAMYRTVGMDKGTMKSLFLTEIVMVGVFGIVFAFIGALGIIQIVPSMLRFIFGKVTMEYSVPLYVGFSVLIIGVMCLISIIPIVKTSKLSIIENIKYE